MFAGHECSDDAICTNLDGTYTCDCLSGFSGDGWECVDVDECRNVVQGQVTAIAPPGAGAGASLSPCVLGDWQHACHNFAGSFNCSCGTGYNGSWPACVDIDECAVGNGGCGDAEAPADEFILAPAVGFLLRLRGCGGCGVQL